MHHPVGDGETEEGGGEGADHAQVRRRGGVNLQARADYWLLMSLIISCCVDRFVFFPLSSVSSVSGQTK